MTDIKKVYKIAEADKKALEARKKAEADKKALEARKKAEADKKALEARKKVEADKKALEARKKAEADKKALEARKKAEADKKALDARKKVEADKKALDARKKVEADKKALDARKKADSDKKVLEVRKKVEADKKALDARKKADSDKKVLEVRKKVEADKKALDAGKIVHKVVAPNAKDTASSVKDPMYKAKANLQKIEAYKIKLLDEASELYELLQIEEMHNKTLEVSKIAPKAVAPTKAPVLPKVESPRENDTASNAKVLASKAKVDLKKVDVREAEKHKKVEESGKIAEQVLNNTEEPVIIKQKEKLSDTASPKTVIILENSRYNNKYSTKAVELFENYSAKIRELNTILETLDETNNENHLVRQDIQLQVNDLTTENNKLRDIINSQALKARKDSHKDLIAKKNLSEIDTINLKKQRTEEKLKFVYAGLKDLTCSKIISELDKAKSKIFEQNDECLQDKIIADIIFDCRSDLFEYNRIKYNIFDPGVRLRLGIEADSLFCYIHILSNHSSCSGKFVTDWSNHDTRKVSIPENLVNQYKNRLHKVEDSKVPLSTFFPVQSNIISNFLSFPQKYGEGLFYLDILEKAMQLIYNNGCTADSLDIAGLYSLSFKEKLFKDFILSTTKDKEYANCRALKKVPDINQLINKFVNDEQFYAIKNSTQYLLTYIDEKANIFYAIANSLEGSAMQELPKELMGHIFHYVDGDIEL